MRPTLINNLQISEHDKSQISEMLEFQKQISETAVKQNAPDNSGNAADHE